MRHLNKEEIETFIIMFIFSLLEGMGATLLLLALIK